ncbi:MAG TPA: cyclase family protein [Polyangiaceae bacterium]|nr:cyclase family protein [Polyangiaceae bacterium]
MRAARAWAWTEPGTLRLTEAGPQLTIEDLEQALSNERIALQRGDAVIVHTGWGKLWGKDGAQYQASNPGLGVRASEWLARQGPILVFASTHPRLLMGEAGG